MDGWTDGNQASSCVGCTVGHLVVCRMSPCGQPAPPPGPGAAGCLLGPGPTTHWRLLSRWPAGEVGTPLAPPTCSNTRSGSRGKTSSTCWSPPCLTRSRTRSNTPRSTKRPRGKRSGLKVSCSIFLMKHAFLDLQTEQCSEFKPKTIVFLNNLPSIFLLIQSKQSHLPQ